MTEGTVSVPHEREPVPSSAAEVDDDVLERPAGSVFWGSAGLLGLLTLAGIVGVILKGSSSPGTRASWGYYAATTAFVLSCAQAAPIIAWITRMARGHWARSVRRPAELFAVGGILTSLLFIPLPGLLPSLDGRASIWFGWRPGVPGVWDALAILFLAFLGLAQLYIGAIPDFASAWGRASGRRQRIFGRLALQWQGTVRQWRVLHNGLVIVGMLYTLMYVLTQLLFCMDFEMSLIPGRNSAIFPAIQLITSVQSGVAITILAIAGLRWIGGYRRYFQRDQFWSLAKILLVLSLFWMYFWWADFLTLWYGRMQHEQNILKLLMFGPYVVPFGLAFLLSFVVPWLTLVWTRVRKSMVGSTIVATSVLLGLFCDRIRLYVAAFSIKDPTRPLESIPAGVPPGISDVLIMLGGVAALVLLYLLALRVVPSISLWEVKEGLLLQSTRRFLRTHLPVIGKPR